MQAWPSSGRQLWLRARRRPNDRKELAAAQPAANGEGVKAVPLASGTALTPSPFSNIFI
jgi:hypothetical protein